MSVDEIKPKLSKEEKSRRKEAKLRAKEAASGTPSTSIPVPASDESKKDKRDKKRKREANGEGSTSIAPGISHAPVAERREADGTDREERKKKKEGKAKPAEANGTNEPEPTLSDPAGPLSKKQLVKLARTHRTSTSPSTSTSTPTSATPTPQPFTPAHQTYLSTHTITLTPSLFPPHLSIPTLPIHSNIITFLSQFKEPTPIQACSWPPLLAGRDVVGIAETGSGKTLAFGAPGLNSLVSSSPSDDGSIKNGGEGRGKGKGKGKDWISMLVLAPTRELALQSHETLVSLGQGLGIASVCLFGGVGKDEQLGGLRRREVRNVVGTPGRTLDLADAGDLDLSNVRYLVLDEADRMLDQGFENDIRRIIGHCPAKEERQTVMFSATWPESVRRLASTFLRDPIRITVGSDELSANKRIEQVVEVLDHSSQKDARMLHHLKAHLRAHPSSSAAPTRILVFALYKKEAQRLESTIRRAGYNVGALHGDMGQDARFRALDKFKNGSVNVLVATDVAARGLDIPDVGLVLNVTFPLTTEDFVHRTGRTGRAGKSGKAVTFFTGENHERSLAGEFMRVLRDVGAQIPKGMDRFPSTIKRKEHGSYGAFYKDVSDAPAATKIIFD